MVRTRGTGVPWEQEAPAGTGSEYVLNHLGMGLGSTAQSGAIDVDFISVKAGALAPSVPEPHSAASVGALLCLGIAGIRRLRR